MRLHCGHNTRIWPMAKTNPHLHRFLKFSLDSCGELFIQLVLHGLAWKRTIWDFRSANIAFSQSQTATALLSVLNRDAGMSAIGVGMFKRGLPTVFIFPSRASSSRSTKAVELSTIVFEDTNPSISRDMVHWGSGTPWDTTTFLDIGQEQ
ncbi:hypothetical protein D9757_005307 [Collybiopsis confluens]|uniref:Uncharacterized protein n=1 Tax=Collybiopsis confluens TaxID=2823264 RepID=A0A8H5HVS0_9AGAR|nr:hypothetical protein D9757_005307 [Collybiopsis confluens]